MTKGRATETRRSNAKIKTSPKPIERGKEVENAAYMNKIMVKRVSNTIDSAESIGFIKPKVDLFYNENIFLNNLF